MYERMQKFGVKLLFISFQNIWGSFHKVGLKRVRKNGYVSEPDQYTYTRNIARNANKTCKTDVTAAKCWSVILQSSNRSKKFQLALLHAHEIAIKGANFTFTGMNFAIFLFPMTLKSNFLSRCPTVKCFFMVKNAVLEWTYWFYPFLNKKV